jgi:hypothetical protein
MKLIDVHLCLDCEEVFEVGIVQLFDQKTRVDCCPSCGGSSSAPLSKWIQTMGAYEKELAAASPL